MQISRLTGSKTGNLPKLYFGDLQIDEFTSNPVKTENSSEFATKRPGAAHKSNFNKAQTFVNFKPVIKQSLKDLGKEEVVLIVHGSSMPSSYKTDTGYGNPNSEGARELIDFVSGVFTGIQFGPGGKTKSCDSSPYTSTLFSSNPLFIDLKQLTEDKYGRILSKKDFNKVVANNNKYNKSETNYSYIYKAQNEALRKAYDKFKSSDDEVVNKLKKEFEEYKNDENNNPWLDNDAIYEALSIENGNDYWPVWENELDKKLLQKQDTEEGQQRLAQIREKYADDIDFYKFNQFIFSKQMRETKEYANSKGVKFIADKQVAFSDRDKWAYQDLFLDGWKLGCPPDYFSEDGQAWGFPVMDPAKLFNEDGSLAQGGEILKKCFVKIFSEYDSLRIDHFLGLVDPWVYPEGSKPMRSEGSARLYSSPFEPGLKKYSIISEDNIDEAKKADLQEAGLTWEENDYVDGDSLTPEQLEKYSMYTEKIILAAAKEALNIDDKKSEYLKEVSENTQNPIAAAKAKTRLEEINNKIKNAIIVEDLGAVTTPMKMVMNNLNLNGVKVSQFMDPNSEDNSYLPTSFKENDGSWYMAGCHDTKPVGVWAQETVEKAKDGDRDAKGRIEYVADYLFKNSPDYEAKKEEMFNDPKALMQAEYTMLLKSGAKNIQIFFADLFGDKRIYNTPGTMPQFNWKTRIDNNFMLQYNEALRKNDAFNFPKSAKDAIRSRIEDKRAQN